MGDNKDNTKFDPNAFAEKLAKMQLEAVEQSREHVSAVSGQPPKQALNEKYSDPNDLAVKLAKLTPSTTPAAVPESLEDQMGEKSLEEKVEQVKEAEKAAQDVPQEVVSQLQEQKEQLQALDTAVHTVTDAKETAQTHAEEAKKIEAPPAPAPVELPKQEEKASEAPEKEAKPKEESKQQEAPKQRETPKQEPFESRQEQPKAEQGAAVVQSVQSAPETPLDARVEKSEEKPKEEQNEKDSAVAKDVKKSEQSVQNKAEIVIKGAKFGSKKPTKEDARTHNVIVARHVDKKRDEKTGQNLSKYNLNYVFAEPDDRDHKFSLIFGDIDPNYLPATTDLRPQFGEALDQGELGSCVSNSVSYCVRYAYKKENLGDFTPSRLFIYYNGRVEAGYPVDEDSGLTIRDGYKSVAVYSVCSEDNWPYITNKFAQRPSDNCYTAAKEHNTFRYINLDNDPIQIKKSLKDGYPVSFGAALFESFMSAQTAQTGIVPTPDPNKDRRVGGHAMTIVGHDDSRGAFIVANNWSSSWGMQGFCYFPYDYMLNQDLVGDLWSIRFWG